jgi:hypothetical protein
MFWVSKVLAPLALIAGIATTTTLVMADGNQPPFGKDGFGKGGFGKDGFGKGGFGKGEFGKGDDKKGDDKKAPQGEKKGPGPKADPQVEAWLAILLTKITDPHDTVRDSARGAVVAVGQPALPALQKLADGDDTAKAVAARKMIAAIQGHGSGAAPGGPPPAGGERGGPGGWGGWRGFGGGPGGFGPPGMGGPGRGPGGPPPGKGPPDGPKRGGRGEEQEDGPDVAPMPRAAGQ